MRRPGRSDTGRRDGGWFLPRACRNGFSSRKSHGRGGPRARRDERKPTRRPAASPPGRHRSRPRRASSAPPLSLVARGAPPPSGGDPQPMGIGFGRARTAARPPVLFCAARDTPTSRDRKRGAFYRKGSGKASEFRFTNGVSKGEFRFTNGVSKGEFRFTNGVSGFQFRFSRRLSVDVDSRWLGLAVAHRSAQEFPAVPLVESRVVGEEINRRDALAA